MYHLKAHLELLDMSVPEFCFQAYIIYVSFESSFRALRWVFQITVSKLTLYMYHLKATLELINTSVPDFSFQAYIIYVSFEAPLEPFDISVPDFSFQAYIICIIWKLL